MFYVQFDMFEKDLLFLEVSDLWHANIITLEYSTSFIFFRSMQ